MADEITLVGRIGCEAAGTGIPPKSYAERETYDRDTQIVTLLFYLYC